MPGERLLAAPGERIDAPLLAGIAGCPAAREQAVLLEPVQHRIDGALRQLERAAAASPDLLDHGIAVAGIVDQGGQHDHVEMALEHFAFHTSRPYT